MDTQVTIEMENEEREWPEELECDEGARRRDFEAEFLRQDKRAKAELEREGLLPLELSGEEYCRRICARRQRNAPLFPKWQDAALDWLLWVLRKLQDVWGDKGDDTCRVVVKSTSDAGYREG